MRLAPAFLLTIALLLAAVESGGAQETKKAKRDANRITAEELAEPSIATLNVYDAIKRLRPNWLRPQPKNTFGGRSVNPNAVPNHPSPDTPDQFAGVIVNNAPSTGGAFSEILSALRTSDVTEMEFMRGSDATTHYGTGYPNGAIVITTTRK